MMQTVTSANTYQVIPITRMGAEANPQIELIMVLHKE